MEVPFLTPRAARTMVEEVSGESDIVVQVFRIAMLSWSFGHGPSNVTRYRVVLSDGENYVQGLAATQLNHLIESRSLKETDVIRVRDYMSNVVQDRVIIILLQVDVVDSQYGRIIGEPTALRESSAGVVVGVGVDVDGEGGDDDDAGARVAVVPPSSASKRTAEEMLSGDKSVIASSMKVSIRKLGDDVAEELKCPISHDLLVDPVTAEDGFQYEREDIQKHIDLAKSSGNGAVRSPKTNLPMGSKLTDAVVVRNTIEKIVLSGAFGDDLVAWYRRQCLLAGLKKRAREKDLDAMRLLAAWYKTGKHGIEACPGKAKYWEDRATECDLKRSALQNHDPKAMCMLGKAYEGGTWGSKDARKAFYWFHMAAERMDGHGMARAGNAYAEGKGTLHNEAKGVTLVAAAAAMQSDCGCFFFGTYYMEGRHGLPSDLAQAKYWLNRAIKLSRKDGRSLDEGQVRIAMEMLAR